MALVEYMKDFFEKYYEKLSRDEINIKRPLNENNSEMWADDVDPNKECKVAATLYQQS